jgi:ribose transport system permease protein
VPLLQIAILLSVWIFGTLTISGFGTWQSIKLVLVLASLLGLASIGQTLLILMGGFDLSVPGFIVAGALMVTVVREAWGLDFAPSLVIAISAAAALGGLGGYICHRFSINPLIVTLALGSIALGLAQALGGVITSAGAPRAAVEFASPTSQTLGLDLPPIVATWAVVGLAVGAFLHRTVPGRHLLATGANLQGAELSLILTRRVWVITFGFSAICSVLAGLAVAGFGGAINVGSGTPYLFLSVVSVLVGGTIFGGPGDYSRTMVGALLITIINVVLVAHGAGSAQQQIIFGVVIVLAVTVYGRSNRISDRV